MRTKHPNIPADLLRIGDQRQIAAFFQTLLDYADGLVQTGMRIKWKSTTAPDGGYLKLDGTTFVNATYPDLYAFAKTDSDFTVGATTTTLPNDPGFWVKT